MGVCFFAYNGAHNVPTVFRELQNRSLRRMKKVLYRAYTILIVLSVLLGVLGYLSYLDATPPLIVNREVKEGLDWPMIVGRVLVSGYLLVAVPININPLRQAV
jgi:amino acid permease|mmetsp:Transcript_22559/g.3716  ORF Transcript_22559/g.3716 Transcript_22559/m.3716 type:complete len:103 (+) Transcript_22559:659-967(+)